MAQDFKLYVCYIYYYIILYYIIYYTYVYLNIKILIHIQLLSILSFYLECSTKFLLLLQLIQNITPSLILWDLND